MGLGVFGNVLPEKTLLKWETSKDGTEKELISDVVTTQNASQGSVVI